MERNEENFTEVWVGGFAHPQGTTRQRLFSAVCCIPHFGVGLDVGLRLGLGRVAEHATLSKCANGGKVVISACSGLIDPTLLNECLKA